MLNLDPSASTLAAQNISLDAWGDIDLIGSQVFAQDALSLTAGDDLNITSTTDTRQSTQGTNPYNITSLARQAGVYVSGEAGQLLLKAGGNITLTGAEVINAGLGKTTLLAGNDLVLNTLDVGYTATSVDGGTKRVTSLSTELGSEIKSASDLGLLAGNDIRLRAADISSAGVLDVFSGNSILLETGTEKSVTDTWSKSTKGSLFGSKKTTSYTNETLISSLSTSLSGGSIHLSTDTLALQSARLTATDQVSLTANQLYFLTTQDITSTQSSSQSKGALWQSQSTGEHTNSTTDYTQIRAADIKINAAQITAEKARINEGDTFGTSIDKLAEQPGFTWLASLKTDSTVNWKEVEEIHNNWDHKSQGLTPAGALIVSVAVAIATSGGSAAAGTWAGNAAGGSAFVGSAVSAGVGAMASQAAISLINNQGDISKTLKELGSKDNLKQLALSMATAGALGQLNVSLGLDKIQVGSATTGELLTKNVINGIASSLVESAITGKSLESSLKTAMVNAFLSTAEQAGANAIGDATSAEWLANKLSHAIAGCISGQVRAGDCSSGSIGAVVGEIAAEIYGGQRTNLSSTEKTDTVLFAKLMGAVIATAAGKNTSLAANAAANAAENNALKHGINIFGKQFGTNQVAQFAEDVKNACSSQGSIQSCQETLDDWNTESLNTMGLSEAQKKEWNQKVAESAASLARDICTPGDSACVSQANFYMYVQSVIYGGCVECIGSAVKGAKLANYDKLSTGQKVVLWVEGIGDLASTIGAGQLASMRTIGSVASSANAAKGVGDAATAVAKAATAAEVVGAKGVGAFADEAKLASHFEKHGAEFGAKSASEYLQIGQDIMQYGQKVEYFYKPAGEMRIGYVQLMSSSPRSGVKFGFVGTNAEGAITTIHTESGNSFWKMLNNGNIDKVIRPLP